MADNVGASLQKGGKERPRQRTPSLDEVREIWAATFCVGDLWGPFFRLCILTGQRSRSDILAMKWSWIDWDKRRYEIPDPKNRQPHIVHLCKTACDELLSIKARQEASPSPNTSSEAPIPVLSPYVFSTTGKTPASGVSRAKKRLDRIIGEHRANNGIEPIEPWVLHDLRCAQATALAEGGCDEGVVDRIQNHVAGGSRASVVASVYNKAKKLNERAAALDAWADMVVDR